MSKVTEYMICLIPLVLGLLVIVTFVGFEYVGNIIEEHTKKVRAKE
jgi:hypothetical protein